MLHKFSCSWVITKMSETDNNTIYELHYNSQRVRRKQAQLELYIDPESYDVPESLKRLEGFDASGAPLLADYGPDVNASAGGDAE